LTEFDAVNDSRSLKELVAQNLTHVGGETRIRRASLEDAFIEPKETVKEVPDWIGRVRGAHVQELTPPHGGRRISEKCM
jgi:hypothetical protein